MIRSPLLPHLAIVPSSKNGRARDRFAVSIPLHELHTEPADELFCDGELLGSRSTDKLIELDSIGGKGIVSMELEPVKDWKPQLSLEGGYNLQVNRLMPSAQTENLSGLLRLVLATM